MGVVKVIVDDELPIDVVMILDNSSSFSAERNRLLAGVNNFITKLDEVADAQMAIVTDFCPGTSG